MSTWKRYPDPRQGEYMERDGLVLTAADNGAWAVFYRAGGPEVRNSEFAPILGPTDLQGAKQAAENAANEMING